MPERRYLVKVEKQYNPENLIWPLSLLPLKLRVLIASSSRTTLGYFDQTSYQPGDLPDGLIPLMGQAFGFESSETALRKAWDLTSLQPDEFGQIRIAEVVDTREDN